MPVLIVLLVAMVILAATEFGRRAVAGRQFDHDLQVVKADSSSFDVADLAA